ncbi:MAG: T9SS type A sorting domain-containing protein, partial [Verrucomicrobia bacterium]|nr:T9SS type A sorting domain-containing protein [Verrucomicrobiota bacterium]
VSSGEKRAVKFQLFKGNEHWFWAGSSDENSTLKVNVYDADGKSVAVEKIKRVKGMGGVRVTPKKTGTYLAVVTINSKQKKIGWALAYGYR